MTATAQKTRPTTVTFDVPGLDLAPLTVSAPCVAALVRAVLDHARPHLLLHWRVYAVINPDGLGHLWDGRYVIGSLRVTGGAR